MIYTLKENNTYYKSFSAKVKSCQKIPLQKKFSKRKNGGTASPNPPDRAFYVGVMSSFRRYLKRNVLLLAITNTFSEGQ